MADSREYEIKHKVEGDAADNGYGNDGRWRQAVLLGAVHALVREVVPVISLVTRSAQRGRVPGAAEVRAAGDVGRQLQRP